MRIFLAAMPRRARHALILIYSARHALRRVTHAAAMPARHYAPCVRVMRRAARHALCAARRAKVRSYVIYYYVIFVADPITAYDEDARCFSLMSSPCVLIDAVCAYA